jgi:hypothetical protein
MKIHVSNLWGLQFKQISVPNFKYLDGLGENFVQVGTVDDQLVAGGAYRVRVDNQRLGDD